MKYHPIKLAFSHFVVAAHGSKKSQISIREEYSHDKLIASFRQRIVRVKERTVLESQLSEVRLIINRLYGALPQDTISRLKDRVKKLEKKIQKI